jgi:hypothetical protein
MGERIPTSVFVHDILDHTLCGLPLSGHRNEAVALIQLAQRTGMDPTPDFAQMVDEDLLRGYASGESLYTFLPQELRTQLAPATRDGQAIIEQLQSRLGLEALRNRLIARFFELGQAGAERARRCYARHGLDHSVRGPLGLALQSLLERADAQAQAYQWSGARAVISITTEDCDFTVTAPTRWSAKRVYHATQSEPAEPSQRCTHRPGGS